MKFACRSSEAWYRKRGNANRLNTMNVPSQATLAGRRSRRIIDAIGFAHRFTEPRADAEVVSVRELVETTAP